MWTSRMGGLKTGRWGGVLGSTGVFWGKSGRPSGGVGEPARSSAPAPIDVTSEMGSPMWQKSGFSSPRSRKEARSARCGR